MANPTITALPEAPQRRMARDVYPVVADTWAAAIGPWTTQVNTVVNWMGQQVSATAASATAADASAKAAAQSAEAASASASTAVTASGSAVTAAQAAQSAAGVPPLNKPLSYLRQNAAGSGIEWANLVVSQVGDTIISTQAPDNTWVPTGRIYNQSTYPALYAKLGAIADWTPSQQQGGNIPNTYNYYDIAYGAGLFVALDYNGNGIAITSPDGVNWTQRSVGSGSAWNAIEYGTNFVCISSGGNNVAVYSPDGVTWTISYLPASAYWTAIKYNNGTYLAASGGSQTAATSTNGGANWQSRNLPAAIQSGTLAMAAGAGIFIFLAQSSTTYYTSPDGINWTPRALAAAPTGGVIYANGMFVIWNSNGTFYATSLDGINWIQYALPPITSSFIISGGGGQFILKILNSSTYYTSVDGVKWITRGGFLLEQYVSKSAYGNRTFVSLDGNGNGFRRIRRPWSYDPSMQFFTTDSTSVAQGLNQYIKAS